ncbi:hypothetical protein Avbf_10949 [Armadillidium vulgare]|nr:hypothetical protein Avbf_10949 [Armadillidium vulgare]
MKIKDLKLIKKMDIMGEAVPTIACLSLETPKLKQNGTGYGLPRVWSNPQIVSHIRPGLEPPKLQQASGTDAVYELDISRGVALKTSREGSPVTPERRQSMPDIGVYDGEEEGGQEEGESAVVGCKIEFRVLDKDKKLSVSSGPTTIVASQTRMSREELAHVVPAPPAFSSKESADGGRKPESQIPPLTITGNKLTSLQSPSAVHEERSIYYDATVDESTSRPDKLNRITSLKPEKEKEDETSKNDESFFTTRDSDFRTSSRIKEDTRSSQRKVGLVTLPPVLEDKKDGEGEVTSRYESVAANIGETSKYESAVHDNSMFPHLESSRFDHDGRTRHDTICEEDKSGSSERRKSVEYMFDDRGDGDEKRKTTVINVQDLSTTFHTAVGSVNRSRTVTPSVSPHGTPPHSEGGRRSRSSRHRRSCEDLLEESSDMSLKTRTPRPSSLRRRSSASPEQHSTKGVPKKSPINPFPDDPTAKSRIPIPTWVKGAKDGESEEQLTSSSGAKSPRYSDSDKPEVIGKRFVAVFSDKLLSPQDEDSVSTTRSQSSDHRSSRGSSLGRDRYRRSMSHEDMADDLADLTPALRRRRGVEKYVTDETQLNLRFQRRRSRPLSDVNPPPSVLQTRNRQRQRLSMIEPGAGGRYFDGTRGVPSYLLKPQIEDSSESESSHPRHIKPRPPPGESPIREVAARLRRYRPMSADSGDGFRRQGQPVLSPD